MLGTALLWVLFFAVFIAINVINPFFVKAQVNGPCKKSLALKMAAATGYLITGGLAMLIAKNTGRFALLMMLALVLSWLGDLFLHLWQHKIFPALGFLGFLSAHFVFIAAFWSVTHAAAPDRAFFTLPEIAAVLAFDVFFLIFSAKIGTEVKGWLKIPILLYATVITTMLCKACVMGVVLIKTGAAHAPLAAAVAIAGAALFVASDFSIAILMFNQKYKKNYALKMFNMVTYFLSVPTLSALILLVR